MAAAGLCARRLVGRADSSSAPPRRNARLEPARRLARDLGAEAGATGDRGAVTYCLRERDETAQDTRQPRGRDRRQCPGEQAVRCLGNDDRSEEHTSELQSQSNLVCRLLLEKKKQNHSTVPAAPGSLPAQQ